MNERSLETVPRPLGLHSFIIELYRQMGGKIDKAGMCFGISNMASNAILAGGNNLKIFTTRLQMLQQVNLQIFQKQNSIPNLLKEIEDLKQKRAAIVREVKNNMGDQKELTEAEQKKLYENNLTLKKAIQELENRWQTQANSPDGLTQKQYENTLNSLYWNAFVQEAIELEVNKSFTYGEKIKMSIPEFLIGVDIYQHLHEHPELTDKQMKYSSPQNAELSESFVGSLALEKLGGAIKTEYIVGAYSRGENMFINLQNHLNNLKHPVSFIINSDNHTLTIGYDPAQKTWSFINSDLPKETKDSKVLSTWVHSAFSNNETCVCAITGLTTLSQQADLNSAIKAWKETPEFKNLHEITENRAAMIDSYGASLLHINSRYGGNIQLADQLIEKGADVNKLTSRMNSPLLIASVFADMSLLNFLCKNGADLDYALRTINGSNRFEKLVKNVTDINAIHEFDGMTLLGRAVVNESLDKIDILINHNADPTVPIQNGLTPIGLAAMYGKTDAVKFLIDHGVDVNQLSVYEQATPLWLAAQYGFTQTVNLLIENGADINFASYNGYGTTPLAVAVQYGYVDTVNLLIDKGANLETPSNIAINELYQWINEQGGDYEYLNQLIQKQNLPADAEYVAVTPLQLAKIRGLNEIESLLENKLHAEEEVRNQPASVQKTKFYSSTTNNPFLFSSKENKINDEQPKETVVNKDTTKPVP